MKPLLKLALLPLLALLALAPVAAAQDGEYRELVLGQEDAPITIIEYSSLTCPHCATFHQETLPRIKEEWIDTGQAKLVFRDFPFDAMALGAAMLVRCADEKRAFPLLEMLFKTQRRWATAENPLDALRQTAKLAGMSDATFDACLDNQSLMNRIQQVQQQGQEQFDINSTPTFIINGEKVTGAQPYEVFEEVLAGQAE